MTLDELREYAFRDNLPLDVSIELTQTCNFRCLHCYCPDDKRALTTEQAKDVVLKCKNAGVIFVNFTGGEVTTRKDFPDIYRYARTLGCLVSIQTNLSQLSPHLKATLVAHKPRNIAVTLYGTCDEEYETFTGTRQGFTRVMQNLDFLHQSGIHFVLKAVLTKETWGSAMAGRYDQIGLKYGKVISWDGFIFGRKDGNSFPIEHRLSAKEIVDFERLDSSGCSFWDQEIKDRQKLDFIKCGGGISSFSIDASGRASICSLYILEKYDFLDRDFACIWDDLKVSNSRMQEHYKNSTCSNCTSKSICRWCSAYAVLEHGNPDKPVPFMCALVDERTNRASTVPSKN
jgi:radical SAM protein with 4Fe4S-binding SPASM domain